MTPKKILIVDDNDDCTTLVKFVLEYETNWQVLIASNGRQGIVLAQSEQPDAILLDIVMPDLNGLDVYKLLKSDVITNFIPIIFMTAMIPIGNILKLQNTENIEVITKPLNIEKLSGQLSKEFRKYSYSEN